MKTAEELKALKEEIETLNKKLAELTNEELKQVAGGAGLVNDIGPGDPRRKELAIKADKIYLALYASDTTEINYKDLAVEEGFRISNMLHGFCGYEKCTLQDVFNRLKTGNLGFYISKLRGTETNDQALEAYRLINELYKEIWALL